MFPRACAETPGAQTPSTIANVDVSSDDGSETLGGLSKVESFGDDPSVEIMRLKALLRQREEELAEKSKMLEQREGLLGKLGDILFNRALKMPSLSRISLGKIGKTA